MKETQESLQWLMMALKNIFITFLGLPSKIQNSHPTWTICNANDPKNYFGGDSAPNKSTTQTNELEGYFYFIKFIACLNRLLDK